MTPEEIRQRVERIRQMAGDDEAAHSVSKTGWRLYTPRDRDAFSEGHNLADYLSVEIFHTRKDAIKSAQGGKHDPVFWRALRTQGYRVARVRVTVTEIG